MWKIENKTHKYNCTIQMSKCQCLVHMLTVKKVFLWQIEPLCFNNVERENGRDQAGGKAGTKWQKYKDDNVI